MLFEFDYDKPAYLQEIRSQIQVNCGLYTIQYNLFYKVNIDSEYIKSIISRIMSQISSFLLFKKVILLTLVTIVFSSLESRLKFPQYCTYYNYPVQQHIIPTEDGVNLKFFRIQKKNTSIVQGKKVVYLQHGLIDSSDTFILNEQHKAPAFVLANRGYDVWVGNIRGNRYSNAALSPNVRDYWDFSFDELAQYDLPASFKYIANKTAKKIHYVGHSQGTLIMFIALSMKYPHIRQNLHSFIALGPIVYINSMDSNVLNRMMNSKTFQYLNKAGDKILLYMTDPQLQAQSIYCKYQNSICSRMIYQISDKNNTVNNLQRLPTIVGHYPAGTSLKNFRQFEQYFHSGKFCKFDYGHDQNIKKYGTSEPPIYDINNIDVPVHLFVGKYDRLATTKDAQRLYQELIHCPQKSYTELDFGHATFIWGKDMSFLQKVIKIIESSKYSIESSKSNIQPPKFRFLEKQQ